MRTPTLLLASAAAFAITASAAAQTYLMMPDSLNNRIALFSPVDGSLINGNYFAIQGGTPVEAIQVNNEIWVTAQIGDRVERYTLSGTPISNITGGMDNVRGLTRIGDTVYVCNDGTGGGAPGNALITFDTSGNNLGSFATPSSTGPFDVLEYGANLLVSSDAATNDIHQYTLAGTPVGLFHNTTSLNFAEQMDYAHDGNILVAGFSSNNVVRLDFNTGALINSFTASGARGVHQLDNGNIMWSNSGGAWVYDVGTQQSTQVYTGGGRFFGVLTIPAPGTASLLLLAGLGSRRRRLERTG